MKFKKKILKFNQKTCKTQDLNFENLLKKNCDILNILKERGILLANRKRFDKYFIGSLIFLVGSFDLSHENFFLFLFHFTAGTLKSFALKKLKAREKKAVLKSPSLRLSNAALDQGKRQ